MSTDQIHVAAAPPAGDAPRPNRRDDWRLSWHGIRTVAQLELRQRIRSTRWKVALVVWFVVVGAITALATGAVSFAAGDVPEAERAVGGLIYGIVVFFVLFLGLLVAPTLSSASINGDRNVGTLATLQATLLSPAEIVLGKLLASWAAALAFLAASVPFIVWALVAGGVAVVALVGTLAMLALVLLVVCAIGLGFSALVTKTSGSAVLTYLTVGGLAVVTPVLFGLTSPLVMSESEVRVWTTPDDWDFEEPGGPEICEWQTQQQEVFHSERTWWLLAANPFVVVADAQPLPVDQDEMMAAENPLSLIQYGVRLARAGATDEQDYCTDQFTRWDNEGHVTFRPESPVEKVEPSEQAVWPWGLGFLVLLGAGAVVVAVRRLRIPTDKLPQGTRVA